MQKLMQSFVRLSAAVTVYGMQQVQTAVESRDPQGSLQQLTQLVDSLTGALSSQLDESHNATVDSVVGRTMDSIKTVPLNPQDLMQATADIFKRTSASVSGLMGTKPSAGEPQAAGEVLAA